MHAYPLFCGTNVIFPISGYPYISVFNVDSVEPWCHALNQQGIHLWEFLANSPTMTSHNDTPLLYYFISIMCHFAVSVIFCCLTAMSVSFSSVCSLLIPMPSKGLYC